MTDNSGARPASGAWIAPCLSLVLSSCETCSECGGTVKVMPKALAALAGQTLACMEDPDVIKKILIHLDEKASVTETIRLPECRVPPQPGVFELG